MNNAIVTRALEGTVCNVGQLSREDVKTLNSAVKRGELVKQKAGAFPIRKWVWAAPGYDFEGNRTEALARLARAHQLDIAERHRRTIAEQNARMPKPIREIMNA